MVKTKKPHKLGLSKGVEDTGRSWDQFFESFDENGVDGKAEMMVH